MSRTDEPAEYDRVREEERYDADESRPWYWPVPYGGWPPFWSRNREAAYGTEYEKRGEEPSEARYEETEEGSWWDEGLITLLIVGGAILFLIPEPATSAVGILLMVAGVIAWLIDWLL